MGMNGSVAITKVIKTLETSTFNHKDIQEKSIPTKLNKTHLKSQRFGLYDWPSESYDQMRFQAVYISIACAVSY